MEAKRHIDQNPEETPAPVQENLQESVSAEVETTQVPETAIPTEPSVLNEEQVQAEAAEATEEITAIAEAETEAEIQPETVVEASAVPAEPVAEIEDEAIQTPEAPETASVENELTVEEPAAAEPVAEATAEEITAVAEVETEAEIQPETVAEASAVPAEPAAEIVDEAIQAPEAPENASVETEPVVEQAAAAEPVAEAATEEPQPAEEPVKPADAEVVAEAATAVAAEELLPAPVSDEQDEEEEEIVDEEQAITDADISGLSRLQLVEKLEETVKNNDVNAIKNAVALIKLAYQALTKDEHHAQYQKATSEEEPENIEISDPVEDRFKAAFAIYRHNRQKFNEELELEKVRNLEAKKQILEELKVLIGSEETLKKTYDDFKALQEKWRNIGMVPKNESQGLWQNYHFLVEKFFDKVKINKELKDLDLKKNLSRKIELCEKAEELILETSVTKSFKRLQELHDEWKDIGPVPQDKRDEVWDRFKMATEKINERRREFYGKVQEEQQANYAAKVLLCEQMEQTVAQEYASIRQWQDSTGKVNELLETWKTIGPTFAKMNNEVWNRFKSQLDAYFAAKKDYFGKLKEQQLHNYNLKVDLCVQAEAHSLSTDWKNSSRELIRLQDEWKKIGPVPRKHSDKIWKRFRTACDEYFDRKNKFFKSVQASEGDNLVIKREIVLKLENFEFSDNRQSNLDQVKELQRQWMETGHVPIKEKDKIQADYKAALNKIYDKLKIDSIEQSTMNYKSRFENIKEQPDAVRIINRERSTLQIKIEELKEEILLWENNIGFFANSKQANVLKAEFEAKIAKAKEEVSKMEAKMKFLNKAAREQEQAK